MEIGCAKHAFWQEAWLCAVSCEQNFWDVPVKWSFSVSPIFCQQLSQNTAAHSTLDARRRSVTCKCKLNILLQMGVFTLDASNIKGIAANICMLASNADWARVIPDHPRVFFVDAGLLFRSRSLPEIPAEAAPGHHPRGADILQGHRLYLIHLRLDDRPRILSDFFQQWFRPSCQNNEPQDK